ncbi:MAG: hypothetical protein LC132_00600 [Burkholderiales bacterium]|nr:hypothetical protein [Burkholderiales bacterium]
MSVDETPDTILQWLEGNLGVSPDRKKTAKAYAALSRADIYLGYTFRNQYYTLWRYATSVMLFGVHDVMKGRPSGYAKIMPPSRWRQMSGAKKQKNVKAVTDLGTSMHMSSSSVRSLYLCPVSLLARESPEKFARKYSLDAESLDILINDPVTAKSIVKSIEDEKKQIEKELKKRQKEEEAKSKKVRASKKEKKPEAQEAASIESLTVADRAEPVKEVETKDPAEKDKKSSQSTLFSF